MIKTLMGIFKRKEATQKKEYTGLSDFFLHATDEEKKRVIAQTTSEANEDQLKTFEAA